MMFKDLICNRYSATLINRYLDKKLKRVKNFIFVATTGRSGTLTLVDIFSRIANCTALHEPYPAMNGNILRAASYGDEQHVDQFYKVRKSVNIRRAALGSETYLEANHLFIKTFVKHAAIDFRERLKVIHLVRDPAKVANSIYSLQDLPGTKEGNRWWLDYRAPTNLIPISEILDGDSEFGQPFYKALWYWFETEARIAKWQQLIPEVPFVFFKAEDFSDETRLNRLFLSLEMSVPENFAREVCNTKSHTRSHQKMVPPFPEETARGMVQAFKALLIEKNFSISDTVSHYD